MERVLLISNNAFSKVDSNGKTIRSFLRGIPLENIAQFYTGTNDLPDTEVCKNYYRVTELQILKSICNLSFNTKNSHQCHMADVEGLTTIEIDDSNALKKIKNNAKNLAFIRELIWDFKTWDTKALDQWISDFNPTIIFAVLGNCGFMHKMAVCLKQRYNIPLAVFFTDDYVINDVSKNYLQHLHFKYLNRVYAKTLSIADYAFVIGKAMQEAYEKKFNRQFGILVNGVDFSGHVNQHKTIDINKSIVISFIGGIHLNRWQSIVKLGSIFNSISKYKIELKVYTVRRPNDEILEAIKRSNVEYCGGLSAEQVNNQIKETDILLHVESFDKQNRLYTKYSISTKIPEYMSSNRGIIAYGPHEIASIRIFSENNIGCVLTEKDSDDEIRTKIINYIDNYNNIDFERQYSFAKANFNQENMLLSKVLRQ